MCLVRFSLKDLEKEYEKTEEHIKAVQSVGQIIGEVMKQLDDERCTCLSQKSGNLINQPFSYCESIFRPTLRCFVPAHSSSCETQSRHTRVAGHDHLDHNAYFTP